MPFIKYKGESIYFETLEEAKHAIDGGTIASGSLSSKNASGPWTLSRFKDYTGRLSAPQLRMLAELVRSPDGRTAKDLASALDLGSAKAFGPVLAAMSRHARKIGISFDTVMKSERIDVGNEKMLHFTVSDGFRAIAAEAKWKLE